MKALVTHHVQLFATPWTTAHQAPLSIGFSRQEYWSELPCPSPSDLPDSGSNPCLVYLPALAGGFLTTSATWEAQLPIAAVTNYQNLNSLKQHRLFSYSSGGQKSKIGFSDTIKVSAGLFASGSS